jgi:ABC-type polysaccharide/polyol phosphate export permease
MIDLRTFAMVMGKELRLMRRYPLSLVNSLVLTPLYQLVLPALLLGAAFLVQGRALGMSALTGTTDFAGWLAIGMAGAIVTSTALAGPARAMMGERESGTLEQTWAMPLSWSSMVLGVMSSMIVLSLVSAALMVGTVALLFGAGYGPGAFLSLPVLAVLVIGLAGMGYMSASLALLWRQASGITDNLGYVVTVLSGVTFPVVVLSTALQPVSWLIPTTWAIDLARHFSLGADTLLPVPYEAAALVLTSVAYALIGRAMFAKTERKLRADGGLAHH